MNKDLNKRIFVSLTVAAMLAAVNISSAAERKVVNEGETSSINNQSFENLKYNGNGGAVSNSGTLDINVATFKSNKAGLGGAIYNDGKINTIDGGTNAVMLFNGNVASGSDNVVKMNAGWNYDTETGILSGIVDGQSISVSPEFKFVGNVTQILYNNEVVGTITQNGYGGAIYNAGTIDSIKNTIFYDNKAKLGGGAIYNNNGDLNLDNVYFENNKINNSDTSKMPNGGAIHNESGNLTINRTTFKNNSAYTKLELATDKVFPEEGSLIYNDISTNSGAGGAILTLDNTNITDTLFEGNKAVLGGAIVADAEDRENASNKLVVKDSEFNKNTAVTDVTNNYATYNSDGTITDEHTETSTSGDGGAILSFVQTDIKNSKFDSNKAGFSGGAIYSENGALSVSDSDFSSNKSVNMGGAIYSASSATIKNSTFDGNESKEGAAIAFEGAEELKIVNSVFKNNYAKLTDISADSDSDLDDDDDFDIDDDDDFDLDDDDDLDLDDDDDLDLDDDDDFDLDDDDDLDLDDDDDIDIDIDIDSDSDIDIDIDNDIDLDMDIDTDMDDDTGDSVNPDASNDDIDSVGDADDTDDDIDSDNDVDSDNDIDSDNDMDSDNDIDTDMDSDDDIGDTDDDQGDTDDDQGDTDDDQGDTDDDQGDTDDDISDTDDDEDEIDDGVDDRLGKGGALYLSNGTTNVSGTLYENNSASLDGGAIYVTNGAKLNVDKSIFRANKAKNAGGAIYTAGETVVTNSEFTGNKAGYGGAIFVANNGSADIKNSTFKNNVAKTTEDEQVIGSGGAILSRGNLNIENSLFESNRSGNMGGGAIDGGVGTLNIKDTDFIGNKTTGVGGAIISSGDVNIVAENNDVMFKDNKADEGGNDIFLDGNNLNLDASQGRKITFKSGIEGDGAVININNSGSAGTVVFDTLVSPYENSTLSVDVKNGTLKLIDEGNLKGSNLILQENGTLDLINGKVGDIDIASLTSNNGNVNIDMDLKDGINADFPNTINTHGDLSIAKVNLLSDMPGDVGSSRIDLFEIPDNLTVYTKKNLNTITNTSIYTISAANDVITVNRTLDNDGNVLTGDMFTVAVNQNDTIGNTEINLADDRTFSMIDDVTITGENSEKGWTGLLGGTSLDIIGNGHTINGNGKNGITVDDGQTLSLQDANTSGFSGSTNGTFAVKQGGALNISAVNNDVTIDTDDNNAIYLEGSDTGNSNAVLLAENGNSININKNIFSNNRGNDLLLKSGNINLNGTTSNLTVTNENANVRHNNSLINSEYNLNGGTVAFSQDSYLNGNNILNFNGGTLNLANGAVGTVNLAGLNINSNSNIMVDADLAQSAMDKLNVDSANASASAKLNISNVNLLSDAGTKVSNINFVDPAITLGDTGETLASHITSSVENVAYSPIYKYGVNYDDKTGSFTFTRGGGGSPDNPDAYNPAVLVAPVAAQAGGYMAMLDTYANGFANMDMRMLSPLSARIAHRNANRYAIADSSDIRFAKSEYNASGMYVRPYTAFDSVKMKRGPKVNNLAYGSFIGGDSAVHLFKNGAEGVFSPFIAYQGNHQNFKGNSVFQNGGTIGFTGTLYKDNFFTGLTAGIGMNVSEVNTMYGNEDFPMLMGGVASKTGYNIEFSDGKFIIQPSFLISYTVVDAFNYTNNAGVSVHSDALHAIQLSPNVKFIFNTKNNWQPYATVGMMWNILDKTKFTANDVGLPELSIRPYVQYGLGLQKNIGDRFTAYGQVVVRNGGRNGVAASFGGRYMLGSDSRPHDNNL